MEDYYLEVVKEGKSPEWPVPREDLVTGSQAIGGGFVQYWAYPKNDNKKADDLPKAEELAGKYSVSKAAILIDQPEAGRLELVLIYHGHAWAKTSTNPANLEGNLTSLIDLGQQQFNLKIEHFMTTERVAPAVEHKLDELAEADKAIDDEVLVAAGDESPAEKEPKDGRGIKKVGSDSEKNTLLAGGAGPRPGKGKANFFWALLPIAVIVGVATLTFTQKERILAKVQKQLAPPAATAIPAPTAIPMPTPLPVFDKAGVKIRVLNGTTRTGAAAKLAKTLESEGWTVASKGNAKNQATPQTTVSVKKDAEELAEKLLAGLEGGYEATRGADLADDDTVDGEVVVGKK